MKNIEKVMHFGAGNIGRGFFGELYFDSGIKVIYVDAYSKLIELLNEKKKYPLWIIKTENKSIINKEISNLYAIDLKDEKNIIAQSLTIDLISISVGANNILELVPILVKIIKKRLIEKPDDFLNIIIGENLKNAALILSENIKKHIDNNFKKKFDEKIGFVETVLSRMVPVISEKEKKKNPLLIKIEEYNILPVSKISFKGELPFINGFIFVDNLKQYQDMKMYIHNFSHSAFAYIGYKKSYQFIWEAVSDRETKNLVDQAVNEEVIKAINKYYRITLEELNEYYENLLKRFLNKELADTIVRVAREPIRKLGKNERFIGTANFCLSQNIIPEKICQIVPYVLNYFNPEDSESIVLKNYLFKNGINKVLEKICGLEPQHVIFNLIKNIWVKNKNISEEENKKYEQN